MAVIPGHAVVIPGYGKLSFPATVNCHSRLRPGILEVMDPRMREDDRCLSFLIFCLIK